MDCTGKVVLVAGATRGIGRAVALRLADAGATVVATGRTLQDAEAVAQEAGERGVPTLPLVLDVRDAAAGTGAVAATVQRFGRMDALVANAGVNPYFVRPQDVTEEMWDTVVDVNLRGIFFVMQAAARQMADQAAGGSIVAISSVTAGRGTPRGMPYVASKGGLDAATRTLAVDWSGSGIRVNGVAPGYIETDLTADVRSHAGISADLLDRIPLGRFGRPEEIAGIVTFLCSDEASYVTGQTLTVDGGMAA